jgi:hypothetical protein
MSDSDTFRRLLLQAGSDPSALDSPPEYPRDDDPPADALVFPSTLIAPPVTRVAAGNPFTSSGAPVFLTEAELLDQQIETLRALRADYLDDLEELDAVADGNAASLAAATAFERRRSYYYFRLMSMIDCPQTDAFQNLTELLCLKNLWKRTCLEQDGFETGGACCAVQGCPHSAVHGLQFCPWHSLRDPNQQLFVPCPVCGVPKIASGLVPCEFHVTGTPVRS